MTHVIPGPALAALVYLALSGPLLAAQAISETGSAVPAENVATAASAAAVCRDDLKSFGDEMVKDGYWHPGDGYGFGYPMGAGGIGIYGGGGGQDREAIAGSGKHNVRPGHEVRVLFRAASILARNGLQKPCEDVLTATRGVYEVFLTEARHDGKPRADLPDWREKQIHAAVPVAATNIAFRSEELLGVEVRNPFNQALGSVDDLVLRAHTDKIAYLVIATGGIFGFDQSHVAVPWDDFKMTPNAGLLVLDTTKSVLDGAPRMGEIGASAVAGDTDQVNAKVDAYWKARQPTKAHE